MDKQLGRLLAVAVLCVSALNAQVLQAVISTHPLSAPAYIGPGDVVSSSVGWWGMRAYSAATKGTKAVNVCNVSDVACADLSTDATTGALVVTTIGGSDCTMVTCTVKIWYDQSGANQCSGSTSCDISNATIGNRPVFVVSCQSSKPCARFAASSNQTLTTAGSSTSAQNQPYTISYVAKQTSGFTTHGTVLGASGGTVQVGLGDATNSAFACFCTSAPTVTAANNAFHAIQNLGDNAASDIYVDGSGNTVSVGVSSINGAYEVSGNSNFLTGDVAEIGVWDLGFTGGNKSAMNSNQHTYWGF